SYRVNIWRGVGKMIGDYWQTGVGIGTDSFRCVYPLYSLSGIESAPHSHNLYLQILVEIGIVGLVIFLVLLFFWAQSCFTLHRNEERREKLIPAALFCGLLAVLAQGMTDYIWYNYRVFLMFWLMLGLCAAARKILAATAGADEY
ncbi:MAG: O-antigen ligase family protein, partial [Clostridia bacterium]|nr:O-antigen ligase family protein [Clostridia bacterium]